MAVTIFMEQSWRKKFSTWPALPLRSSKLSPRLNTLFAKLGVNLSSATVTTGIFCRVQRTRHVRNQRLRNLPARKPSCHSERSRGIPLQNLQLFPRDPSTSLRSAQDDRRLS